MSHLTTVRSEVRDLDAVRDALSALNEQHGSKLTLDDTGDVRFYYGTHRADHVIKFEGRYDMGLTRQADGTYAFVCDSEALHGNYGRGQDVRRVFGDDAGLFLQEYAAASIARTARLEGHGDVTRETARLSDGSIVLRVRR